MTLVDVQVVEWKSPAHQTLNFGDHIDKQYYQPTMLPQMVEDINQRQQHEDNDDDNPIRSPQIRPR